MNYISSYKHPLHPLHPLGSLEDEANIEKVVLATYPMMKLNSKYPKAWISASSVIVRTYTGGVGGEGIYLCVLDKSDGQWKILNAYLWKIAD
jgi:hypothetical protein